MQDITHNILFIGKAGYKNNRHTIINCVWRKSLWVYTCMFRWEGLQK